MDMAKNRQNNQFFYHLTIRKLTSVTKITALCLAVFIGCSKGESPKGNEQADITESVHTTESNKPLKNGQVAWNDRIYTYNDHLSNFVIMGVDKEELVETEFGRADAGQTDALFLLSWDRVTGDVTVVTIPRDTMTSINVFGRDGTDLGPRVHHISLAYGFGDGKHESCRLTREAVSRLFYRLPIQGYCAVTMDAIEEISKVLGPVRVTIPNDSLKEKDAALVQGAELEVTEENVELFVRYRDTNRDNSALHRSERQSAYLQASYEKLLTSFQADSHVIADLYEAVTPYMVTNMGNDQFYKIMEGISQGGRVTRWIVPGEGVITDRYDEYHVDQDAFYEQILNSFFEEESS